MTTSDSGRDVGGRAQRAAEEAGATVQQNPGLSRPCESRTGLLRHRPSADRLAGAAVLFVVAAFTRDKSRASGLDAALEALRQQPFGQVLLSLVAVGFISFGLFCFVWAKNPKQEHD